MKSWLTCAVITALRIKCLTIFLACGAMLGSMPSAKSVPLPAIDPTWSDALAVLQADGTYTVAFSIEPSSESTSESRLSVSSPFTPVAPSFVLGLTDPAPPFGVLSDVIAYSNGSFLLYSDPLAGSGAPTVTGALAESGTWQAVGDEWFSGTGAIDKVYVYSNVREVPPVPLPAALPLFATGLGMMGLLGWRKRRRAQTA